MKLTETYNKLMSKELLKFVQYLENCGLLYLSIDNDKNIDFEKVIFNYLKKQVDES